jgi:hypothetical protein
VIMMLVLVTVPLLFVPKRVWQALPALLAG